MNLTSQYRTITTGLSNQQKPAHIENVPHSKHLKDEDTRQRQKLNRLFPDLDQSQSGDNEPTVFVDQKPLVDELV